MHYDWVRFLVPRHGAISLDSAEFLRDPSDWFGTLGNPDLKTLADLAHLPVVVILGEPGMGKSNLLREAKDLAEAEGRAPVLIDLGQLSNEERLRRRLTTPEILGAGAAAPPADLLIDSLDTGQLSIPTLGHLLAEVFLEYPHTADLRVRLTCRSTEWPSSLEDALIDHWGDSQVGAFELAPLRRKDVALAARAECLDADAFLASIEASQAGALANRPVTLGFLLRLAKEGRPFPDSRVELYRQGCELLCAEDNPARRQPQRRGNRTPSERLTIAARIAAVLMLASREAVWIGPHADLDREQDCSVNDLVGRALMPSGDILEVTQNDLFETLDTGLFWLRGPERLHFAHQSYGEFLAAWYLKNQRLPAAHKLDLLSDPSTGGLVPQLHEVTAWAAAMDRDLFRSVLAVHPPVLLGGDVATAQPELRAALVDGILKLAGAAEWADTRWGLWAYYPKLAHPGLTDQLRPWIQDKGRFVVARGIAIDIAEACGLAALQDALVALALDCAEETSIRSRAVDALGEVADQTHRAKLIPLLDLPPEDDPEDAIKGYAMRALWPNAIDLDGLLAHIRPRRNPSHSGSYWRFVSEELAPCLSPQQLPRALIWIRERTRQVEPEEDYFRITSSIVARAIEFVDVAGVADELAQTALRLLSQHGDLLPGDLATGESNPLLNIQVRRRLLQALLPWIQDADRDSWLLTSVPRHGPAIVGADDVPWLLELAMQPTSRLICRTLARLIEQCYRPDQANAILEACACNPFLRRALSNLCGTVWLGSPRAQSARKNLAWRRESEARRVRPPPVPPPNKRIAAALARIDAGDADAFVQLMTDLALQADGRYVHSSSADLRLLPGWLSSDPATQSWIIAAAARYLTDGDPEPDKLLERGQPLPSTSAAVNALFLLDAEGADSGIALPEPDWRRWAPVTLPRFMSVDSGEHDWAENVLRRAYGAAPDVLQETIRRHLNRDLETRDWVPTAQGLEPIWDDEIARILLAVAEDARGAPEIFRSLFKTLLRQGSDRILDYGLQCLETLPLAPTDAERINAVSVAALLVEHRTADVWPLVWTTMQRDRQFGRMLVAKVADAWSDEGWWTRLGDQQLGDLSLWVERQFPREEAPRDAGDGWTVQLVGASWDLDRLRSKLLDHLVGLGTPGAVSAVSRIASAFPGNPWFRLRLARARESLRRVVWRPPSPGELLMLTADSSKRLVRNAPELLKLVLESLGRLQERLTTGWNPLVRSLWDQGTGRKPRPKGENFFSDFVCDHLNRDLKGVAAQREVEARNRREKGVGERTDIAVTATSTDPAGTIDSVSVVIECKGCWNKALATAMEDQLKRQYLIDEGHRFGLYLVGWAKCEAWDDESDGRLRQVPDWTFDEAVRRFDAQADALSDGTYCLRAFVMDLRLPGTKTG